VALVAAEHVYILIMEMFLWRTPRVRQIFGTTPETAETSAVLAANQGLYNGFLAAGLFWSLVSAPHGYALKIFFLGCVVVAGVYGGLTAKPRIVWVQALPAALALLATLLAG
jgi:putative membrane protein